MLSGLSRVRLLAQAQPLALHTCSRNTADCLQPGRGMRDDGGAGTGQEPGGKDAASSQLPGAASLFSKESTRNVREACPSLILPCSPQPCFPHHHCPSHFQPTTPRGVLISPCFSLPHRICHSRGGEKLTEQTILSEFCVSSSDALHTQRSRAELQSHLLGWAVSVEPA